MNRTIATLALVFFCACDGPAAPTDSGAHPDAGLDSGGPTSVCDRDSRCEDGLYCTINTCRPGDPAADENGCIVTGTPCSATETCSEADRRCEAADCSVPDRDDDGHDSIACDGDDCDDDDPRRYPGGAEVCGPGGDSHDEDCRDETLASADDGDMDGDGEVRSECCNGDSCGTDCDDSNPLVNTTMAEVCNGVDDDCSGAADDPVGGALLCPGGACLAGRCAFTAWDRTVSSPNGGFTDIASDGAGNLYVVGDQLQPGTDFGAGPTATYPLIASYSADGVLRWLLPDGADNAGSASEVAIDASTGAIYVLGGTFTTAAHFGPSTIEVAPGDSDGWVHYLGRLDSAGNPMWAAQVEASGIGGSALAARDGVIVVAGSFDHPIDLGDGMMRTPRGALDAYIAAFDSTGAVTWVQTFGASGAATSIDAVDIDSAGNIYAGGWHTGTVDLGGGAAVMPAMDRAMHVIALGPSGDELWAKVFDSSGRDAVAAVAAGSGLVFVTGELGRTLSFGGETVGSATMSTGYLLAMTPAGGYVWERTFDGVASFDHAEPKGLAVLDDDRVWVVGGFVGAVDFGGGSLSSDTPYSRDGFMVLYGSDGLHLRDRALGRDGDQVAHAVVLGVGGSTTVAGEYYGSIDVGSGARVGSGAFLVRTSD